MRERVNAYQQELIPVRSRLVFYHMVQDNKRVASDFISLDVWKESHQLMLEVYAFVKPLPPSEKYNRIDQLIRASASVPANIAEGHGRYYYLENIAFCRKARGSLYEVKNHLMACKDLRQAENVMCNRLIERCDTIRRILNGYIRYLKKQKFGNDEV